MPNSYQVTLTWPSYPNQGTITSLVVSRDAVDIATLPASATTFTDDGTTIAGAVEPLTTYDYAVTVHFNNGCPTRALDAIVDVGCYAGAPTNVTLTDNGDGTATVDWFPPGLGLPFFGYKISWGTTPGGPYTDHLFVANPFALSAEIATGDGTFYVVVQGMDSETCLSDATTEASVVVTGQNFGITWEPPELDFPGLIGKFAFSNASNLAGITDISFGDTTNPEGYDITHSPDVVTLAWPNLIDITDAGFFRVDHLDALTTVTFGALTSVAGTFRLFSCNLLATITGLAGVTFLNNVQITACPILTSLDVSGCIITNGKNLNFQDNALDQASVDGVLAMAVANAGYVSGNIILDSGTNSAPSVTGTADKNTLILRGVTVATN